MKLWTINRWLRWTGFRLFVIVAYEEPTVLAIRWVGLYGSRGWHRIQGTTP